MQKVIIMNEKDNVATCLVEMNAGDNVVVTIGNKNKSISLIDPIPFGHKFSLSHIDAEDKVMKYGEVIGIASRHIEVGQHVHVHNVDSIRARGDKK